MDPALAQRLGISWEEGVHRCADNPALYEKFLGRFALDPSFARLEAAMAAENWPEAFLQAHTLKGVAGNLSLTRFYGQVSGLVELLREGRDPAAARRDFPALQASYRELVEGLSVLGS